MNAQWRGGINSEGKGRAEEKAMWGLIINTKVLMKSCVETYYSGNFLKYYMNYERNLNGVTQ